MKKLLGIALGCCLGVLVATGPLWAAESSQKDGENVFSLGEVVVRASSAVADIAVSNVITAQDIQRIGAVNAGEALAAVPGVNLTTTSKGTMNINIRGFGQKDVLVLIDGVPYYETKNGPLDLQQIPASIISRIEVVKGASSVMYGPNALGGVVNIVTQKAIDGLSGTVSAEVGRGGYYRTAAALSYGAENGLSIMGTVDHRNRDTLFFSGDYEPRVSTIRGTGAQRIVDEGGEKDNTDLNSLNLWTRVGYSATDTFEAYASVYRFNMQRGRPFSDFHNKVKHAFHYSSFGKYEKYQDVGIDIGSRIELNDWWALRVMSFFHHHVDDYTSFESERMENKMATSRWDDDSYGMSLFSDTELGALGNLSLTAQYRKDKHKNRAMVSSDWEHSESSTLTFAAEDTVKFGSLTAVLGAAFHHFDANKIVGNQGYAQNSFDPMIGLTWAVDDTMQLFGSIAKKTRFPVFADMESHNVIYVLKPEQNISYTIGYRDRLFDMTNVEVAGFVNDVTDRITKVAHEPANIGSARMYGVDLQTFTDITSRLGVGLDYVYTDAANLTDGRESNRLRDIAQHQVIARIEYLIPTLETQLTVRGTYKGNIVFDTDSDSEDSFVVDVSLTKKWDNGFSLGAHIYNLFDHQYYAGSGMAGNGFDCKLVAQYTF